MTYQAPTTSLRPKSRPTTVSSSPRPPSRPSQKSSTPTDNSSFGSFVSPTNTGSGGLASPTKPKKQEEKLSMVDRFWSLFDSTGGTVSEDDTTSSSERALSFYDTVDMTLPEVPQVSMPSELAPTELDPYVGAVGTGNRDVAPNTMDSYLKGDAGLEAIMPPASTGLMTRPAQGGVSEIDTSADAPESEPAEPSSRLDDKGREVSQYEVGLYSEVESDKIRGVQGVLSRLGYVPRGIDGSNGAGTRSAIRHYQRANALPVTGEADAATLTSLKKPNTATGFTFSDATDGLYTNYVDDGIEGAGHHLGGADYRDVGITLEAGIVPDSGLKYKHNGTVIDLPNNRAQRWSVLSDAGVTRRNFDTGNVITDDVVKAGIRRKDYSSDEDFTKAVLTGFQDKAEDTWVSLGYDRDTFNTDARKTLADMAWNAGTDAIGYNSMRPVLTELAKDVESRDTTAMRGLLNTAPTQSGRILGGVMKRRAIQYNWSVPEEDRIERVTSSSRTGQGVYHYANGDTYTISRTNGADTQDERVPTL